MIKMSDALEMFDQDAVLGFIVENAAPELLDGVYGINFILFVLKNWTLIAFVFGAFLFILSFFAIKYTCRAFKLKEKIIEDLKETLKETLEATLREALKAKSSGERTKCPHCDQYIDKE